MYQVFVENCTFHLKHITKVRDKMQNDIIGMKDQDDEEKLTLVSRSNNDNKLWQWMMRGRSAHAQQK